MRFKPSPVLLIIVALAVVAASCGVSREAGEDVLTETSVPEQADGGTTDPEGTTPSTVAIPVPPYEAPDYGDIDTAATVIFADGESVEIPVSALRDVIEQVESNPEAAGLVFGGGLPATFDLDVLSSIVQVEVLEKALALEGVSIPTADDVDAELLILDGQLDGVVGGEADPAGAKATIQAGISEYLELIATQRVNQNAYTDLFLGEGFEVPCARHILLETEDEADAAIVRLDAGEDFAGLAAELSTGPSGPNGGDLGCSDPNNFVVEFKDAIESATIGEVVGPVETQFGFHVILVYETGAAAADPSVAQQAAFEAFTEVQSGTRVTVDPAIGIWNADESRVVSS